MILKIKTETEISVPAGTKVISNDTWLTLVRKNKQGNAEVLTIPIHDIGSTDFLNENNWTEFSKKELRKAINII